MDKSHRSGVAMLAIPRDEVRDGVAARLVFPIGRMEQQLATNIQGSSPHDKCCIFHATACSLALETDGGKQKRHPDKPTYNQCTDECFDATLNTESGRTMLPT